MGEDREKVSLDEDEGLVADVEGHSLPAQDLVTEREATVDDEDVEGHALVTEDLVD